MSTDTILIVGVLAVVLGAIIKVQRRRAAERPFREAAAADTPRIDVPVQAKVVLRSGRWFMNNTPSLRLQVGERFARVVNNPGRLGAFLGTDWAFDGADTSIERGDPARNAHHRLSGSWIVLAARSTGTTIALSPPAADFERCWEALVAAGFSVH